MHKTSLHKEKHDEITKDLLVKNLHSRLFFHHVSAPLFCESDSGIQVYSDPKSMIDFCSENKTHLVLYSLDKWKRIALKNLNIKENQGIYTYFTTHQPNGIEEIEEIKLIDWELRIHGKNKTLDMLTKSISHLYEAIYQTAEQIKAYSKHHIQLPENLKLIHINELEKLYPEESSIRREEKISKKFQVVAVIGSGSTPSVYKPSDVNDFSTNTTLGKGLNAEIFIWNPKEHKSQLIATAGIRVDNKTMIKQMILLNEEHLINLPFHQMVMHDELPQSIGGAIYKSTLANLLYTEE